MGKRQGQVVTSSPDSQCVTVVPMALGLLHRATIVDDVAALADSFADRVIADLATVATPQELHDGLSGSYLVFLREALLVASSQGD